VQVARQMALQAAAGKACDDFLREPGTGGAGDGSHCSFRAVAGRQVACDPPDVASGDYLEGRF